MTRLASLALAGVLLFLAGCQKKAESPSQERWAVLLFDDLSADTSHRWLRRGIPEQLGRQLRRAPRLVTILSQPDPQAARAAAIASGVTHIARGYYDARDGRLEIHVQLEDIRSGQSRHLEQPASGDPVKAIGKLARQLDPNALPSPVKSAAALQAFSDALNQTSIDGAIGAFRKAIQLDPDFGAAYLGIASVAATAGRMAEATEILRQGAARSTLADSADRAQVVSELSALSGDRGSLAAALVKQAQTLGSDAQAWARASEAWIRAQRPDQAEKVLTQALKLTPESPEYLNQLAYARAYQGNVQGATAALDQYRKLRPGDPNALDSMGDVYYFNNRFVEAAGFYRDAFKLNPNFFNGISLLKAAYATLWTGNIDAAAKTFEEYRRARELKNDPTTPIYHAEFLFFSGKRSEGWQLLQNVAGQWAEKGQGPLASRAYSLAAIWSIVLGDAEKARALSAKARASSGGSTVEALSLFLTMPPAPAQEWVARAPRVFPPNTPPAAVTPLIATALVLGGHYEAALPYLDKWESLAAGEPGDFTNVLKTWVLYKLDRLEEARKLVQYTPLIPATGLPPVSNLVYPRIFFLRARLAEKEGRQDEARKLDELFLKLSGDRDKIFGEEAISRTKLGR